MFDSHKLTTRTTYDKILSPSIKWHKTFKLAKNAYRDKCVYTGYGIGLNTPCKFLLPDGSMGKNIIIFGVDMSSYVSILIIRRKIS